MQYNLKSGATQHLFFLSQRLFFSLQISKSSQDKADASTSQSSNGQTPSQQVPEDIFSYYEQMDKDEEEEEETQTVSFEIRQVVIGFFFRVHSFIAFTCSKLVYLLCCCLV